MANGINNKYEYRSGLLDSLKVQHTASDVRNEDEYRKKVLNGLGVEYTEDDINQKNLYRAKVVEGLASSGGGGGSSDFSTAEVTVNVEGYSAGMPRYGILNAPYINQGDELVEGIPLPPMVNTNPFTVVLYKNSVNWQINAGSDDIPITGVNVTGSAEVSEYSGDYVITITGDANLTITYGDGGK